MTFRVDVKIPLALREAPERLKKGVKRGIERSVGIVTNDAIRNAPRKTGNLKRSIQAREVTGGMGSFLGKTVQDKTVAKYGAFVEFGTGLYGPKREYIYAKNSAFLAWRDARGWHKVMAVKGMKAQPFMRPALRDNVQRIEHVVQEEINNALKRG